MSRSVRCRASSGPAASPDQVESTSEAVSDGGQWQHRDLPGDQLDRERQSVEVLEDLHERTRVERR